VGPFALVLLLLFSSAGAGTAESVEEAALWLDPSLVTVRPEEIAFADVRHTATATQSLYMVSRLDDGRVLMFDLFELDMPVYHRWGIYALLADPSGSRQWRTHEFGKSDVVTESDHLRFSDGTSIVESVGATTRIDLHIPGFACSLRVEAILPSWRGGDGLDAFTDNGRMYLRRVLACPWGEIEGWVEMDGRRTAVHGQTLLERSTRVSPLNRQYEGLTSVRAWGDRLGADGWFFELSDITSNQAYGAQRIPRLAVARADRWLFTTESYTVEPAEFDRSSALPYPAPRRLDIVAHGAGFTLTARYRVLTLFDVTDILTQIPPVLRPLVRAFLDRPVSMRFLGELEGALTWPDGTTEVFLLHGPFEYVVLK
jgi:hypothetical protein